MSARDYLTLLKEQAWLIGGFVVLGIAAALLLTVMTPRTYASDTTFYVVSAGMDGAAASSENYSGTQMAEDRVKSYAELAVGSRVAVDTSESLGGRLSPDAVQASLASSSVTDTVLLTVTATDATPEGANELARAFTGAFTRLVDDIETTRGPASPPAFVIEVVQAPTLPVAPMSPRPSLYLPLGAIIGLMVGLGVAIARRSLRRSVGTTEELEEYADAAVLATVSTDRALAKQPVAVGAGADAPRATLARAEAYRRLRTNVEFAGVDGSARMLVVTSALHDEGKTVTAANLASALAAVGRSVLLVEADLRRPRVLTTLGLTATTGLTDVVVGSVSLEQAVVRADGGFDVLGGGRPPAAPNELFATRRMGEVAEEMRRSYDLVVFDTPPVLPVADALTLGRVVDGAIVVCRAGFTARDAVREATTALRAVGVTIVGAVLSHVGGQPRLKPARAVPAPVPAEPVGVGVGEVESSTSDIPRAELDSMLAEVAARDAAAEPVVPQQAVAVAEDDPEPEAAEPSSHEAPDRNGRPIVDLVPTGTRQVDTEEE